jgi:hypothetical protein
LRIALDVAAAMTIPLFQTRVLCIRDALLNQPLEAPSALA